MDNKRVERLEVITQRLMRRSGKTAHAMITPYPISSALFGEDLKGPILRYMFPCDGTVMSGIVRVKEKPKSSITLDIKLFNDTTSVSKGFSFDKKFLAVQPNIPVLAGDCLEISLVPSNDPVTEIWIALLWKPTVQNIEAKSFLIEEIENDLQERTKSLIAEEPCREQEKDRLIVQQTDESKEGDSDARVRVDNRQGVVERAES